MDELCGRLRVGDFNTPLRLIEHEQAHMDAAEPDLAGNPWDLHERPVRGERDDTVKAMAERHLQVRPNARYRWENSKVRVEAGWSERKPGSEPIGSKVAVTVWA